jgi:hypothetical protein
MLMLWTFCPHDGFAKGRVSLRRGLAMPSLYRAVLVPIQIGIIFDPEDNDRLSFKLTALTIQLHLVTMSMQQTTMLL